MKCVISSFSFSLFKFLISLPLDLLGLFLFPFSAVNNTSELGPVKVMTFLANETSITLANLNSSTLYKFYLSAMTIKGSGPAITEEAFTVVDTSEFFAHKLYI